MTDDTVAEAAPYGVRLGVDVGQVRIGVARSDPAGILATPVETIRRRRDGSDIAELLSIAAQTEAVEIVVGLPRHLSGASGQSADDARRFATRLARAADAPPVRLLDERLTTVSAHSALHASGRPGRRHREVVDQVAAVLILQNALDTMRRTGRSAGEDVSGRPTTSGDDAR